MTRRDAGLMMIGVAVLMIIAALLVRSADESNRSSISASESARILMGGEPEPASPVPLVLGVTAGVLLLGGGAAVISSLPATKSAESSEP